MKLRKVDIISTEFIKPISPTPYHLRCLDFSILDQLSPLMTVPFILYYPLPKELDLQHAKATNLSRLLLLKKSLSQTLARFYPFAGRINRDYTSINCNDNGVPFSEAFAHDYHLDEILEQPNSFMKLLRRFLPYEESLLSPTIPMLVQVTFFECGGMTIGICASHKITDAPTLNTLINGWAIAARRNPKAKILEFVPTAKFLPPVDNNQPQLLFLQPEKVNNVTKIFFFDASCIASLKAKTVSDSVLVPTRVEALSALIWKCAMATLSSKKEKSSLLVHTVNLRKRLVVPLPSDCMGNAIALFKSIYKENDTMDLPGLVTLLRKGLLEFRDKYENKCRGHEVILGMVNDAKEIGAHIKRDDMEMYNFTSWCRFQFYDADFGWGSPSWVSRIEFEAKNHVLFIDTKSGGGIEAWVSLDKALMEIFEQDIELLNGCGVL
ncbi:vinorine synthase-like [Lycium barbarum]|uniref:vinorine synthase-like n=1 Tax=Lycium barbarum TaxID=112863 RepID=UPI00293E9052|nr:vinorine synthase-like [Lycium barbarum]